MSLVAFSEMHYKSQNRLTSDFSVYCVVYCVTVFTENDSSTAMDLEAKGDANSDEDDVSAPVKRRRKMALIDEDED